MWLKQGRRKSDQIEWDGREAGWEDGREAGWEVEEAVQDRICP